MSERSLDTSAGLADAADRHEPEAAGLRSGSEGGMLVLAPYGHWQGVAIGELHRRIGALELPGSGRATIDLSELRSVDSAGAWLIHGLVLDLQGRGVEVAVRGADPDVAGLLDRVSSIEQPSREEMAPARKPQWFMILERAGRATHTAFLASGGLLSFLGATSIALVGTVRHPRRLRLTAFLFHIEQTGLNALGIVGLINFLIGLVLAYMGATQLAAFGAEIYAVDLVGIAVLREMGILLTAIIVAGRSGSAFTAQIGAMKAQQEIDAMRTIGVDPLDALVLPRLFALLFTLPALRLRDSVDVSTFLVGMSKAPVFAVIIAMVGCYEGLKVGGSAESVGKQTTRSVVESIFLVIVFDALFAIMYSYLGI
jgi:phospholipid/cholesterol/gamma-HCH transport system permease protein